MALNIQSFRGLSGDRVVLDNAQQPTGARKAEIGLKERFTNWLGGASFKHGNQAQQQANRDFKASFLAALTKAEGAGIANKAASKCGLKANWQQSPKALSGKQVTKLLDTAQHLRMNAIKANNKAAQSFLKAGGAPSFSSVFASVGAHHGAPAADLGNRDLQAKFLREVRRDPAFGQRELTPADLGRVAAKAINEFYAERTARFNEQHPGLAQFALAAGHGNAPRADSRTFFTELSAKLSPGMAAGHPLAGEPVKFRYAAGDALDTIKSNYALLNKMAYDSQGMQQLGNELHAQYMKLHNLEQALQGLAGNDAPQVPAGQNLQQGLVSELRHQKDLLLAKAGMLDDMRKMDPFSEKTVAYSTLLWANAASHIVDDAVRWIADNVPNPDMQALADLQQHRAQFVGDAQNDYNNASTINRTPEPGSARTKAEKQALKQNHPVVQGKAAAEAFLRQELRDAGMPDTQIDIFCGKKNLGEARRKALDHNQTWAPVVRDMVVNKDGLTRTYRSKITPGSQINARLGRLYNQPTPPGNNAPPVDARPGVSSANKADHYHARNLKLSELERVLPNGATQSMGKVVGHGVLDSWDIEDPIERQNANRRGAKEVLETAVSTNDRITQTALNRKAAGDNTPVKVTHVSVNLITPSTPRDWVIETSGRKVMPHHMEGAYTDNQFRAFAANTTAGNNGQPVTLKVDDTRPNGALGQDVDINVDVDVISFSFAINPLATGITIKGHEFHLPDSLAGWSRVYEHNQEQMVKFVGDLGTGAFGAQGSRPGGFIGDVYDRLDPNIPAEAELMAKIREQTDIVRDMFTSEAFKHGDGDPAKMSRHILVLQGLAEEALALTSTDDMAATMSKGCKSDKDRGGVTDVEFKHMLVSEDMGGEIRPNETLEDEDQENYYVVAANSGQFENQQYNTGIAGSKEAGKLAIRAPDKAIRQFLAGLGTFASE